MIRRTFALLLPLLFASAAASAYCPIDGFWVPSAEVDGKIGSFRKGAGITLFAPVCQDDNSLVFWQTNFGNYRKVWTGSLGLGYRRLVTPWAAIGVNGFADVSYSEASRTYGQLGFGGELLGRCWEARFNGYIPTTRRTCVHEEIMGAAPFVQEGTQRFFSHLGNYRLFERSYKGFDAEAGYSLKFWRGQLWGYGGYYWFDDRGAKPIEGPRVRLEYHLFNLFRTRGTRVVLAGEWAYDHLHGNQGLFLASLRIPLCGFKKGCGLDIAACHTPTLCQRMNNRVIREPGIWIDRTREDEHYDAPILGHLTGGARHLYFVSAEGNGDGSLENPLSLNAALARSGPEDLLFLLGELGVSETIALKHGQTLIGSQAATEVPLDFVEFGVYTIANNGQVLPRARLIGDGVHDVVQLAHHGVVRDIDIDASGASHAIVGDEVQNVRLSRGRVANTGGHAIAITDALNLTAYDLDFHNVAGDALWVSGSNVVLRQFELEGVVGNGITIRDSEGVLVDGLHANSLRGHAVDAENSARVVLRKVGGEGADHAVTLQGVKHYALHDSDLASKEGTTLALTNCHGQGLIKNSRLKGIDSTVLAVHENQSVLAFEGSNSVNARGGTALEILQSSGSVDGTHLALTHEGGPTRFPVHIENAKEVKLGEVALMPTGECLATAFVADSTVQFGKLIADNREGAGLIATRSRLSINDGQLSTAHGPVLSLSSVDGEMGLALAASINSPTQGIALSNFNGKLAIRELEIAGGADGALLFDGGEGMVSATGAITTKTGPMVRVRNLKEAGAVSLYGLNAEGTRRLRAQSNQGILLEGCEGSVMISGADIEVENGQAYMALNSIGRLTLAYSKLASGGATPEIVGIYNGADFNMHGCELIGHEGNLLNGVAVYVGSDLPEKRGIDEWGEPTFEAPSTQQFCLQYNTFLGAEHIARAAVDLRMMGAPGITQAFIEKNDTGSCQQAYSFRAGGPHGRLELVFKDNKGERAGAAPIQVAVAQEGRAAARILNRQNLMEYNPELIGGHLESTGRVENLWEAPQYLREESEIIKIIGGRLHPTK